MMAMIKPLLIGLNPLHADEKPFPHDPFPTTLQYTTLDSVDDEMPIYHFFTIEKVAVENESEGSILFVLGIMRV